MHLSPATMKKKEKTQRNVENAENEETSDDEIAKAEKALSRYYYDDAYGYREYSEGAQEDDED